MDPLDLTMDLEDELMVAGNFLISSMVMQMSSSHMILLQELL